MTNRTLPRFGFARAAVLAAGLAVSVVIVVAGGPGSVVGQGRVEERKVLDNERVSIVEFVFPAGFKGDEHEAPVDEFAYVLDGEFAVVTKGKGKRTVQRGEVEWAPKGVVHYSLNETKKPARVLVVLLKEK